MALQRFPVPSMGDSISEGTLLELHKAVGDTVGMEEAVALVETDKVTVEVRSPAAGRIVGHDRFEPPAFRLHVRPPPRPVWCAGSGLRGLVSSFPLTHPSHRAISE